MATLITGEELGNAVFKALGLTGAVARLVLTMEVNEMATLEITRLIDNTESGQITEILSAYALVKRDGELDGYLS